LGASVKIAGMEGRKRKRVNGRGVSNQRWRSEEGNQGIDSLKSENNNKGGRKRREINLALRKLFGVNIQKATVEKRHRPIRLPKKGQELTKRTIAGGRRTFRKGDRIWRGGLRRFPQKYKEGERLKNDAHLKVENRILKAGIRHSKTGSSAGPQQMEARGKRKTIVNTLYI